MKFTGSRRAWVLQRLAIERVTEPGAHYQHPQDSHYSRISYMDLQKPKSSIIQPRTSLDKPFVPERR
jgi:hypothetical protein